MLFSKIGFNIPHDRVNSTSPSNQLVSHPPATTADLATPTAGPSADVDEPAVSSDSDEVDNPLPAASLPADTPTDTPAAAPDARRQRSVYRDDLLVNLDTATVKSVSGYVWYTRSQVAVTRTPARNLLLSFTPGPTQTASQAKTPVECFKLFVTDTLVDKIVQCTNQKIEVVARQYQRQTATVQPTNAAEIRALIGILVFSGYRKDNHLNTKESWCLVAGTTF